MGLHRNGAVDGIIYRRLLPQAHFLIAARLRKSRIGKLFFHGIEVVRSQDPGNRSGNAQTLARCVELLRQGGSVFFFPEGSSTLGPTHLPFHTGAMRVAQDALACGVSLQVIPLGIHYEAPTHWQRDVEVVVGPAISTDLPPNLTSREQVDLLHRRMTDALKGVGVNVPEAHFLAQIETLAYAATLGSGRTWFESLKALERGIPAPIQTAVADLERVAADRHLWRHQGVPLFPIGHGWLYLLLWLLLAPLVGGAVLLNLLPLAVGLVAGRTLADEPNVITLWRAMTGIPLFLLQLLLLLLASLLFGHLAWFAIYGLITLLGLRTYYRFTKLTVAVHNALRHPDLRPKALALRQIVLAEIEKPSEEKQP